MTLCGTLVREIENVQTTAVGQSASNAPYVSGVDTRQEYLHNI